MTFRPSVLPDRDNDILSTFVRSFERARQLRRADQADSRASAEFTARQEDREAQKQATILQSNLAIREDPSLSFDQAFEVQQLPGTQATVTAEGPEGVRAPIASARGPTLIETAQGESVGTGPGGREIFFSERAGEVGREQRAEREIAAERRLQEPERREAQEAAASERRELEGALRVAGVGEEDIRVLVRDPPAARQRLQSISAQAGRAETAGAAREDVTTGGERERTANIEAIKQQFKDVDRPISDAQAAIFEANPRMMEDALRPIPQERQDIIMEDLDRMQDVIDDIEADELSNPEKLERKKRALIDGGYMGPAEAFSVGLARFQEARQEARSMAGTFLQPQQTPEPGAGPAAASGLGGNEPRQGISSAQIPAAAALIEDLNFTERNEELDRVFPGMTQADRAAVHRAAGPAPVISGEPGSEVGAIPGEEPDTTGGRQGTRGRRR